MLALFVLFTYVYTIVQGYGSSFFGVFNVMTLLMSLTLLGLYRRGTYQLQLLVGLAGLVSFMVLRDPSFSYLTCIVILLLAQKRFFLGLVFLVPSFWVLPSKDLLLLYLASGLLGYYAGKKKDIEADYLEAMDQTRRTIYELEGAKSRLHHSQNDLVHMTELNERNRIARSIHDNLGHKLVGTKMLLEAAHALNKKGSDQEKALTQRVIKELAESVDLLRDTVHDLRPNQEVGLKQVKTLVDQFSYCPIQLVTQGDMNQISSGLYAILQVNLKEGLTNISKYARCKRVQVRLEVSKKYVKFVIEDDGVNTGIITEGLGLSGIRQRVENIGGTFTINQAKGFQLHMFFPSK